MRPKFAAVRPVTGSENVTVKSTAASLVTGPSAEVTLVRAGAKRSTETARVRGVEVAPSARWTRSAISPEAAGVAMAAVNVV